MADLLIGAGLADHPGIGDLLAPGAGLAFPHVRSPLAFPHVRSPIDQVAAACPALAQAVRSAGPPFIVDPAPVYLRTGAAPNDPGSRLPFGHAPARRTPDDVYAVGITSSWAAGPAPAGVSTLSTLSIPCLRTSIPTTTTTYPPSSVQPHPPSTPIRPRGAGLTSWAPVGRSRLPGGVADSCGSGAGSPLAAISSRIRGRGCAGRWRGGPPAAVPDKLRRVGAAERAPESDSMSARRDFLLLGIECRASPTPGRHRGEGQDTRAIGAASYIALQRCEV